MTRQRITQAVTILVLGGAIAIGLARRAKTPSEPQDTVYAVLAAARTGDVKGYLACYTGPMLATLSQTVRESTEPAFARYLRETNAVVKGLAVGDPQKTSDLEVSLRVEYIYQERNEA